MNIKQKQLNGYGKVKYSEIKGFEKGLQQDSRIAMLWLLQNGYTVMNGYAINEIFNLIRALREMKIEFTLKTIDSSVNQTDKNMYYEFTLLYFEDDRK